MIKIRSDAIVEKLLREITERPEKVEIILSIVMTNPHHYKWVTKTVFHYENFSTPEKCEIMGQLGYDVIRIGLISHLRDAGLYTAAVCLTPIEGKEKTQIRYKKLTEERIRMHMERMRVLDRIYDRIERETDTHGDEKTKMFLRRVSHRIRRRCAILGIETPARFEKLRPEKLRVVA